MGYHGGIVCVSRTHTPNYDVLFRCNTTEATRDLGKIFGVCPLVESQYLDINKMDPWKNMYYLGLQKDGPRESSLMRQANFDFREQWQLLLNRLGSYDFYFVADLD